MSLKPATLLLEQFDYLLTTPEAVAELNRAILTLAVQGKLVAQDPQDEPAGALLKRGQNIEFPRDETIKLPNGWIWVTLPELGEVNPRNSENDSIVASFIPMTYISEEYGVNVKFDIRPWGEIKKGYTHLRENDVVVAKITPCFENGKAVVMRGLINGIGAGTTELHVFRGDPEIILPDYVLLFFKTPQFQLDGAKKMTGSAGQQRVPKEHITKTPFPLPPLAEQHRIFARVEALFAQTRQLAEKLIRARRDLTLLNQSALAHLLAASASTVRQAHGSAPEDFAAQWDFIAGHFESLFTEPEHIAPLRQAILELAVCGKLTRREPGDEPASTLLERIQVEKAKAGKSESLPMVRENEKPFELPEGWEWTKLQEIADIGSGVAKGKRIDPSTAISLPYLRVANVQRGYLDLEEMKEIEIGKDEIGRYSLTVRLYF